jgi:sulfatase maturation enzyme AslB (radical SAM superfamily)
MDYDDLYDDHEFSILISSKCNLCCSYCYENNKRLKVIELEKIKRFINYVFEKYLSTNTSDRIIFKILGGEILLEPHLVDKIISYINFKAIITNSQYKILITTNGTLLNNIFIRKLLEKWKGVIMFSNISFDGSPINQDINRIFKDGTGSTANIFCSIKGKKQYFFLNDISFNYTIAKNTIKYVHDSLAFFLNYFVNLIVSFEMDFLINSENELNMLVKKFYEIENISVKANRLYLRNYNGAYTDVINKVEKSEKKYEGIFCYKLTLNEDGDISPCISYIDAIGKKLALLNIDHLTHDVDLRKFQLEEITNLLSLSEENKTSYEYCPVYLLIALNKYKKSIKKSFLRLLISKMLLKKLPKNY